MERLVSAAMSTTATFEWDESLHPRDERGRFGEGGEAVMEKVQAALTDDLRRPPWKGSENPYAGHCYVASEALYHLLGGTDSDWHPQFIRHEDSPHWFLRSGEKVLDPTKAQFKTPVPYDEGRGKGFLTKEPSARARTVIERVRSMTASVIELEWDESLHPRDERGRFGEKGDETDKLTIGGTPTERIQAAMPWLKPEKIDIERLHPIVQERLANSVEKFVKEFPVAARGSVYGFTSTPKAGGALGVYGGDGYKIITLSEKAFGTGKYAYRATLPDRETPRMGAKAYVYEGRDGPASVIDHELGHALFDTARIAYEGVGRQSLTRNLLGLSDEQNYRTGVYVEKGPSTRAINASMREISDYGPRAYSRPEYVLGHRYGASHDLNEGFSEWFAARQQGDAEGKSALMTPVWERMLESGRHR